VSVSRVPVAQALAGLAGYSAIVDTRSESEFALDHLPDAVNWPTLDDAQRHLVGTEYKQISAFEARKRGAILAARNVAGHVEREAASLPRDWKPLVYCWRGGQRSGALALVLGQIGFEVQVLEGGYREFRRAVIAELERLPSTLRFQVLCGRTGSGKSRLLAALAAAGAQVLDLEGLARHRGSVLGSVPGTQQPSQKHFETLLWDALRRFDPARPVFVESESRTVGRLRVPEALLVAMRAAPCHVIDMPLAARVQLLMQDYAHHLVDVDGLCQRLQVLREARGAELVDRWISAARAGRMVDVVNDLLESHYDPIYQRSMARNFDGFERAAVLRAADGEPATLAAIARTLVTSPDPVGHLQSVE
jgi:tRNA 2-selenouridine synthase